MVDKCIETLNEVADQFLDVTEEHEIYLILSEAVKKILPGAYFLVSRIQPDDINLRIIESSGFDKYFNIIKTLIGQDPYSIDFPIKDMGVDQIASFSSRKLYHFPGGIHDLVDKKINESICRGIERMLDLESVYAMRFFVEKKYFGGMILFIPHSLVMENIFNLKVISTLESVSKYASVLIQNLRDKYALRLNEKELLTSYERFTQLTSQLNDIFWKADGDGTNIVDLNGSFEKIYGLSSFDFNNNPNFWIDLVHPDDRLIAQQAAEQLFANGNSISEYRILRPDGRIVWLHDRKSIIYDKSGIPIQMGGRATDITDRKILENELKIKNSALDDSPTAVGLADINGVIFYINDAYVKLFEFNKKEEILGKKVLDVTDFKEQAIDILNCIQNGKTYSGEVKSIRNDGSYCYFIISARAIISDNKPVCLIALFTDISERKQTEMKLLELSDQLKDSNSTKDKFFSIIAHDLKSPFNSILGFTDLLANEYYDFTDKQRLEYIKILNISAQNTYKLLENLLEWASLQSGQIRIYNEILNLKTIVDECFENYSLIADEKRIVLRNNISEDTTINADSYSIKTVLRNLINNALKFTPLGGSVSINASFTEKMVEISVQDSGIGIEKTKIDKLFRIEESVSTMGTKGEKGTGLGLILCRELILQNQGEIHVESELGKGTTFKIAFPRTFE